MAPQKRGNQVSLLQKRGRRQYHPYNNVNGGVVRARAANPTVVVPDDVLDGIFSYLPIKKAVQFGTAARRFNDSWLSSRKMFFDREFALGLDRPDFISIVNRVFDLHEGPNIDSLRLYFDPIGVESIVENWIKKAIEKGVHELEFDFIQARERYELKSDFLDVESLRVLKLHYCNIELPQKLEGLRFLNTLVLKGITLSMRSVESLFTNCLSLVSVNITQCYTHYLQIYARHLRRFKVLKIGACQEICRIDIDAPTLHTFYYCGGLCIFKIGDVSKLNNVMLNFLPTRNAFTQHFKVGNLVSDFSHVQVLTMSSTFLEGLCSRYIDGHFKNLQYCFWNLRELQLFMDSGAYCNLYDIATFIKNCLCIEKLFIDLNDFSFSCGYYWELHQKHLIEQDPRIFHRLKFIKIKGFKFQKHELLMLKYFLQKAIYLETLVLVTPKNSKVKLYAKDFVIYDQVFLCWKASKGAEMFLYEHMNDTHPISPTHSKSWDL